MDESKLLNFALTGDECNTSSDEMEEVTHTSGLYEDVSEDDNASTDATKEQPNPSDSSNFNSVADSNVSTLSPAELEASHLQNGSPIEEDGEDLRGLNINVYDLFQTRFEPHPLNLNGPKEVLAVPYCRCADLGDTGAHSLRWIHCKCGEDLKAPIQWTWVDTSNGHAELVLTNGQREVSFHPNFSHGTAGVRGSKLLTEGIHYWEIKMVSPVYGTDMMIGVGCPDTSLTDHSDTFVSLLGLQGHGDSMGLSYTGNVLSNGQFRHYCARFGQGSIVGILLDLWHGTLTYYLNRKCLGVAFSNLNGARGYYPMVTSTAARSGMKLIRAESAPVTLQTLSCRALRGYVAGDAKLTDAIVFPPGLQKFIMNNVALFCWLSCSPSPPKDSSDGSATNRPSPQKRLVSSVAACGSTSADIDQPVRKLRRNTEDTSDSEEQL